MEKSLKKFRISKEDGWSFVLTLISVIMTAIYPLVFLYTANINEASFVEILSPMIELIAMGFICAGILLLCRVPAKRVGIPTVLLLLLFCNYAMLEKVIRFCLPMARYWHILPSVLLLWVLFCWWYATKAPSALTDTGQLVVAILFSVLVLINVIAAIPQGLEKIKTQRELAEKEEQYVENEQGVAGTATDKNQPNIYLMIYDEYASFEQLEKYWNYGNDEFREFLENHSFMVSDHSRNEYPGTKVVLSNLLNLDYVVDSSATEAEYSYYWKNAYLFEFLKQCGYTINAAGDVEQFGFQKTSKTFSKAKTMEGYTIEDLFVQKTMLYPMRLKTVSTDVEEKIADLADIEAIAKEGNTSQFTVTYITSPHQPFIFDENGNINPANERQNWDNYLNQLKYISNHIEKTVESILNKDSKSIIVICSDHGARGNGTSDYPTEIKCTVLNAVYFLGEYDESLLNLSGVNTLRMVLNKLGLANFEQLEVPYEY